MPARGPLQVLLRLRGIEEARALGAAARATQSVLAAQEAAAKARTAHLRRPLADAPMTPLQLRAVQLQGVATHDMIEAAEAELASMVLERRSAERELVQASSRHKSVERLLEGRAAEAALAAGRVAERTGSELFLLRRGRTA